MTAILVILGLGLATWAITLLAGRLPVSARLPLAIAVMAGLTGYLLVGQPGVPGAPPPHPAPEGFGDALEDPRAGMSDRFGDGAQWLGMADGLLRNGNSLAAAQLLEQGLRQYPRNVDLWVGYGNALVAHSGGLVTPAAQMAFQKGADVNPAHPMPPYFFGLALAQSGDIDGARAIWQELLNRTPADAPWRDNVVTALAQLPPVTAPAQGN